jgi:hypothetical protein
MFAEAPEEARDSAGKGRAAAEVKLSCSLASLVYRLHVDRGDGGVTGSVLERTIARRSEALALPPLQVPPIARVLDPQVHPRHGMALGQEPRAALRLDTLADLAALRRPELCRLLRERGVVVQRA